MSYIVKNCPARPIIWNNNWCNKEQQFCQNCNDCVIKQVIDKCNSRKGTIMENFAEQILDIFDIEEINK